MIVLIRLEAEGLTMQQLLHELDRAEEAVTSMNDDEEGKGFPPVVSDEHYERMLDRREPYFKARRVFKFDPFPTPASKETNG